MLSGGLGFSIIVAKFTSSFTTRSMALAESNTRMQHLREYSTSKNLPRNLRKRIMLFYETYYGARKLFDEKQMLSRLPVSIYHTSLTMCKLRPFVPGCSLVL